MAKDKEKKESEKKEPKRKPKYGFFSCVGYMYRLMWRTERSLVYVGVFTVPTTLILSALTLYTPSIMLQALETSDRFSTIALIIVGLMLAKLLFELVNTIISERIDNAEHYVALQMTYQLMESHYTCDRYHWYQVEVRKKHQRAVSVAFDNGSAGVNFPTDFSGMLATILNFILFGSVISLLHPVIILLLAVGCAINYAVATWVRKANWKDKDDREAIVKKINYISTDVARNFKLAKDIRLYGMKEAIHKRMLQLFQLLYRDRVKRERRSLLDGIVIFLNVLIRDAAAYTFLVYKAVAGEVDASSFVLYFSAIASMSDLMSRVLEKINRISEGAMEVSDYREALELEDRLNRGQGIPVPKKPFSIEFKNVSYQYPEGEKKILDHVSFKIEAGEKIALVGLNGAGKTTLTMLMCGILLPDEGEILLDGHTLYEYNRDEMYGLFGLVPQQFSLLPISIAKNIACTAEDEEIDREKVQRCIDIAGLTEKIASLELGMDTPLNKQIHKEGIELSGGETQKLLLARVLYKNPPCIILDEPTAALDPIAEDHMYRKYDEIASNATAIFISHRLASTRFSNRIFLLDGAHFTEEGSHEELMAAGGKYKELFDIQSKYYREGVEPDGE